MGLLQGDRTCGASVKAVVALFVGQFSREVSSTLYGKWCKCVVAFVLASSIIGFLRPTSESLGGVRRASVPVDVTWALPLVGCVAVFAPVA